jgi:hypothetical protein
VHVLVQTTHRNTQSTSRHALSAHNALHQTAVSSIDRALRAGIPSQTTWDIARLYQDAVFASDSHEIIEKGKINRLHYGKLN